MTIILTGKLKWSKRTAVGASKIFTCLNIF